MEKNKTEKRDKSLKTIDIAYIGMMSALICISAWITVPTTIPFTMQTFAIFFALCLFGGKRGTISVVIYVLLGMVGLPVFANFKSGLGTILGPTGGYVLGFILIALIYWIFVGVFGEKYYIQFIAMILGLIICYTFGTAWFINLYTKTKSPIGVNTALSLCVYPFILPDVVKMIIAFSLAKVLKKHIKTK